MSSVFPIPPPQTRAGSMKRSIAGEARALLPEDRAHALVPLLDAALAERSPLTWQLRSGSLAAEGFLPLFESYVGTHVAGVADEERAPAAVSVVETMFELSSILAQESIDRDFGNNEDRTIQMDMPDTRGSETLWEVQLLAIAIEEAALLLDLPKCLRRSGYSSVIADNTILYLRDMRRRAAENSLFGGRVGRLLGCRDSRVRKCCGDLIKILTITILLDLERGQLDDSVDLDANYNRFRGQMNILLHSIVESRISVNLVRVSTYKQASFGSYGDGAEEGVAAVPLDADAGWRTLETDLISFYAAVLAMVRICYYTPQGQGLLSVEDLALHEMGGNSSRSSLSPYLASDICIWAEILAPHEADLISHPSRHIVEGFLQYWSQFGKAITKYLELPVEKSNLLHSLKSSPSTTLSFYESSTHDEILLVVFPVTLFLSGWVASVVNSESLWSNTRKEALLGLGAFLRLLGLDTVTIFVSSDEFMSQVAEISSLLQNNITGTCDTVMQHLREVLNSKRKKTSAGSATKFDATLYDSTFWPLACPRIFIGRLYSAEGVKSAASQAWGQELARRGRGGEAVRGRVLLTGCENYVISCFLAWFRATNHMVAEAALMGCKELFLAAADASSQIFIDDSLCFSVIKSILGTNADGYIVGNGLIFSASWPVRDACTVTLGTIIKVFPVQFYSCYSSKTKEFSSADLHELDSPLVSLFSALRDQLTEGISSVRENAAKAAVSLLFCDASNPATKFVGKYIYARALTFLLEHLELHMFDVFGGGILVPTSGGAAAAAAAENSLQSMNSDTKLLGTDVASCLHNASRTVSDISYSGVSCDINLTVEGKIVIKRKAMMKSFIPFGMLRDMISKGSAQSVSSQTSSTPITDSAKPAGWGCCLDCMRINKCAGWESSETTSFILRELFVNASCLHEDFFETFHRKFEYFEDKGLETDSFVTLGQEKVFVNMLLLFLRVSGVDPSVEVDRLHFSVLKQLINLISMNVALKTFLVKYEFVVALLNSFTGSKFRQKSFAARDLLALLQS